MADKRISQLVERVTLANNDVFPIVASGATTTNKVTLQTIDDYMQTNLDFGVTSVAMTVPTGLSVTGTPVTSTGTFVVTFTAGYSIPTNAKQTEWDTAYNLRITSATAPLGIASNVISITQSGASSNGYLSSTDWNTFNNKQNALTFGNLTEDTSSVLTITGGTGSVIGSGTTIQVKQATSSQDGFLDSADWTTFNNKQNALSGTGIVKSTGGTITYLTDNTSNWDSAYNDKINSASVTGTTTKTLTLNQQDGGTITTTWTDLDTGTVTSVGVSMPSAFSVANSPITSSGTIAITGAGTINQYIDGTGALQTFPSIISQATNLVTEVYNNSGATLSKGTVVYITGGQGNLPTISKALATGDATSAQTYGVVQNDITNMNNGYVVVVGRLIDLDTQAYANGTQLYLSGTTAGAYTSTKPYAPIHLVYVGIVVRSHPTQGVIEVKIQNGYEMDEIHDVSAQNPSDNDILQYKSATGLWTKVTGTTSNIAEGLNLYYTDARSRAAISESVTGLDYNSSTGVLSTTTGYAIPTTASQTNWDAAYNDKINSAAVTGTTTKTLTLTQQDGGTITATWTDINTDAVTSVFGRTGAVVAVTGDYNTDQVTEGSSNLYFTNARARSSITLTTTGTSGAATYNSTTGALNIPNYSPDLSGYVPTSRTLTINGTTYDLSANRSWTITAGITGSGTNGQVTYWNGTSSVTGSTAFTFSPNGELYIAPSNTAGSGIAVGMNLNPTLIAGANNDVLSSLLIRGTFTNGAFTGVQNWLIIAEGSNNRWLRYNQYGLWLKQNDNTHVTALNLENALGVGYGVGMNFTLGYDGTGTNVGTPIVGARIQGTPETSWTSTASTQDAKLEFSTAQNGVLGTALTLYSAKDVQFNGYSANGFVKTYGSNGMITIDTTSYQPLLTNPITGTGNGVAGQVAYFTGANAIDGVSAFTWNGQQLQVGQSVASNNTDYNIWIIRHGTSAVPGSPSAVPALNIQDYANAGANTWQITSLVDISFPRISIGDVNSHNTNIFRLGNDDITIMQVSAKGRVFIGKTSEIDNGQQLQVNGSSLFDGDVWLNKVTSAAGIEYVVRNANGLTGSHVFKSYNTTILTLDGGSNYGTFQSNLQAYGDFQLLGSNPRIDYPNGSSFRLYQAGVGTKFEVDGTNFTFYGTGVDSPKISLRGLNYVNAAIGDTTTGTSDIGNLWLYNDGNLVIRLDADNGGISYVNAGKFAVGVATSNNAKFRVRNDDTDATYTSKIQAVFGPTDYLDSDAVNLFGGGTAETQFSMGNASRPAMISLGGNLNTNETIGVINFFRSNNTDGYRSRAIIHSGIGSTGTANQHGAFIEFMVANDDVQNPVSIARFEPRGSFIIYRRNDNMTFADSVGALYVRQNGNGAGTEEEFRMVGRNIGFFNHTGTRWVSINSSGVLAHGYQGTPAATSKIFISRGDQYGMHLDAGTGYARIQTTDDALYLRAGSNDRLGIFNTGFDLQTDLTGVGAATPTSTIRETGVSRTITGYGYDVTQPLLMIIGQTSPTLLGLSRMSEDTIGASLKGMKGRGTAAAPASVANGDVCFAVEGYAWHGSGPNYTKFGGGMRFVKDDAYGVANTHAPMRTEFWNANSTTSVQTTFVIYPNGNVVATGDVTAYSDARVKKDVNTIEKALEKTLSLRGVSYFRTDTDKDKKKIGVIAQEIREVLPEVVLEDEKGNLSVSYGNMVGLLIEAVKEQQKQIDELKKQVA